MCYKASRGYIKGDQVQWLVDASKSVYRLLWLRETGLFDVRVIHLVKDPRTFGALDM